MTTYPQARAAFDADPDPESLASAYLATEHLNHHGQPLRFVGSSYDGDWTEHRFACADPGCAVAINYRAHGDVR